MKPSLRLCLLVAFGAVAPGPARAVSRPIPPAAALSEIRHAAEIAPPPADGERDRDRIVRMQGALRDIVHGGVLRRTRVGIRVMDASTGRLFFSQRSGVLMDPASNQKVLATTTALVRLGADWRFRTELSGPLPTADGIIVGDVILRGSGNPTLRSGDLDALATALARRGVRSIVGAVVADPRRIGADETVVDEEAPADDDGTAAPDPADAIPDAPPGKLSPRVPLVVNHGLMLVRVRPGAESGMPAEVTTTPADPSFVIHNNALTKTHRHSRVTVRLKVAGARIEVDVDGRVSPGRGGMLFRRRVPHQALYAAALMRAALGTAGITVRDDARVEAAAAPKPGRARPLLALHESAPLAILMRKINKDSENDYAERVLEAAGAEVYGGAPTEDKGVRLLREVIGELGLPPGSYVPRNGSGLGHANRITADSMAALLRTLYLDPRVGPELLQSLSVGGVDGTTRNRFKGTLAAERVRAKTGTLHGKSCLSGLVGDGKDVLAFSILVEGLRGRSLAAVRGAQVGCVNAMMRYVVEARGGRVELPAEGGGAGSAPDLEAGEEVTEGDEQLSPTVPTGAPGLAHEDPVDALLRKDRERTSGVAAPDPGTAAPGKPAPGKPAPGKPAAGRQGGRAGQAGSLARVEFRKYHGLGNDYLVLDPGEVGRELEAREIRRICDRNYGVGADGLLWGPLPAQGGFGLRIFNPDGGEAEKSGNGVRIFARCLFDRGLVATAPFVVVTQGGPIRCRVHPGGGRVDAELGRVSFDAAKIPVRGVEGEVLNQRLVVGGQEVLYCAATVGNPHCVLPLPEISAELARRLGPLIENDPRFPNRTNVQFMKVLDRRNIQIEIWERGAGYTLASGTSSSAAAAVARRLGLCDGAITVHMPGGALQITVGDDYAIEMSGPVTAVAAGTIADEAFA